MSLKEKTCSADEGMFASYKDEQLISIAVCFVGDII